MPRKTNLYSYTHCCWSSFAGRRACWWVTHSACWFADSVADHDYTGRLCWKSVFAESWPTSGVVRRTIGFWPTGTVTWSALSPFSLLIVNNGGNRWLRSNKRVTTMCSYGNLASHSLCTRAAATSSVSDTVIEKNNNYYWRTDDTLYRWCLYNICHIYI